MPQRRITHLILAVTVLLISCDLSTIATVAPPTPVPGAVNTIVAMTAAVASTQTAAVGTLLVVPTWTPTPTLFPTSTPSATPSPTPTFLFLLPTLTRTPTANGYACTLLSQSPSDGSTIAANADFNAKWNVRNTGTQGWDSNTVDFIYLSGAKFTKVKTANLPTSVDPGNKIALTISMTAPGNANTYKTTWTLEAGKTQFCKLTLNIVVK